MDTILQMIDIPQHAIIEAANVMLLMLILIIIDTVSKWLVIVHKFNTDKGIKNTPWSTFRGIFFRAWQSGYLESGKFRNAMGCKVEAYLLSIAGAVAIYLLPDYHINGLVIDETISMFIYVAIVLMECFSITENLKTLGVAHTEVLENAYKAVMQKYGINPNVIDKADEKVKESDKDESIH